MQRRRYQVIARAYRVQGVPNVVRLMACATVALLVSVLLTACDLTQQTGEPGVIEPTAADGAAAPEPTTAPEAEPTTAPEAGQDEIEVVTLSDIANNPDQYTGQRVTLQGDLDEVLGPRSFTLGDPALLGFDSLLVVGASEAVVPEDEDAFAPDAATDAEIQVTGTVRQFDRTALESELGYQFPGTWASDYADRPAIIADEVNVLVRAAPDDGDTTTGQPVQDGVVTLSNIDDNTEQYLGQTVSVNGEVDEALGQNAFRLDEGGILDLGDQILVVLPDDAQRPDTLQNETSVQVTGEVRNFARDEFEQEFALTFDDEALYEEFEGQPAIIANRVNIRASVSDVDDDEAAYIGNRVTVRGDVTEQLDERTYRLDDPALLGGDDILFVTSSDDMSVNVGDQVFVTGEVREFDQATLSQEIGWEWDAAVTDLFSENTIIVAENLQVIGQVDPGFLGDIFGTADDTISISDIGDNPDQYIGQQATVSGEVSEVLGPNVVRIDEDNLLDIGDDLLVVIGQDVQRPNTLEDETNIQVTGTVRNFVIAEFERDPGLIFDDPELYAEFENEPAIVAERIQLQATLSDIDDNPEAYIGNDVRVYGAVEELIGTNSFRLEDPQLFAGDDLLVVMRDQTTQVEEGAEYYVSGTVQRFNLSEAEAEAGVDLEDDLFTGWTDRTVIIADSVTQRSQQASSE